MSRCLPDRECAEILIPRDRIAVRVRELAREIDSRWQGRDLTVITVMKGALFFAADLMRELKTPVVCDFIQARSYEGTESSGTVRLLWEPSLQLAGKELLVIDDIFDTGLTAACLRDYLFARGAKSVSFCFLLNKKVDRKVSLTADFVGFDIEPEFVVGYGLDYEERFRALPDVCVLRLIA